MRPKECGYVELRVAELDPAIDYYRHIGGLQVSDRRDDAAYLTGGWEHHWVVLRRAEKPGLERIAYRVAGAADLERFRERLEAAGVPLSAPPEFEPEFVGDAIRFADPSGNTVELFADMVSLPTRARPRHIGVTTLLHPLLQVPDVEACYAFYHNLLGFDASDWNERSSVFLHCDDGYHHSLAFEQVEGQADLDHICFLLDDLDSVMRSRAMVQRAGITIFADVLRHAGSGSIGFYFEDPNAGIGVEHCVDHRKVTVGEHWPRTLPRRRETFDVWQDLGEFAPR